MASRFYIKQGDTRPFFIGTLLDSNGVAISLAAASTATFRMRPRGSVDAAWLVNAAATFTEAGVVTYEWAAGDTDRPGTYEGEVVVDWDDGTRQTFPSQGTFTVVVGDSGVKG